MPCNLSIVRLFSLRKTVGKSVTDSGYATSRSDSNFERSNISLKENKRDGVDSTSNGSTTAFERMKEKFYGFRQTVLLSTEVCIIL